MHKFVDAFNIPTITTEGSYKTWPKTSPRRHDYQKNYCKSLTDCFNSANVTEGERGPMILRLSFQVCAQLV